MQTDEALKLLEEAAASAPFARLLAATGGRRVAHAAPPGHPFAAAVLAHALDVPVLTLAPDPRSADDVASATAAFLGPDRVLRFPSWESLPYEGISPGPQVAGARAEAAYRLRRTTRATVVAAPVLAALQSVAPNLGLYEPLEVQPGATLPP
jgi:transcription-repair coupling factor (superfamily II helicase)